MKLAEETKKGFEYHVSAQDAYFLRFLVKQFPPPAFAPARISKTDSDAAERENWLNESLAAHRDHLRRKARNLVNSGKFKMAGKAQLYRISREGREIMLQILNELRVESWRILGEPENLDLNIFDLPREKIKYHQIMTLAGYFEHHFLNLNEKR